MGRNLGLRDYQDHDPNDFTIGFWTGAFMATVGCSVLVLIGLYLMGVFG